MVFIYDTKSPPEKNSEKKKRWLEREKKKIYIENISKEWLNFKRNHNATADLGTNFEGGESLKSFITKLYETDASISFEKIEKEIEKLNNSLLNIRTVDFNLTKDLLTLCQIPFIDSDGEAESTCSYLLKKGKIAAILTEDTDVLAYGCSFMIHNINFEDSTFVEIDYNEILKKLKLTCDEFLDFCILCGTDYNETIPNIDIEKAYKLIYEFKSIENIYENNKEICIEVLNHELVRSIYKTKSTLDYSEIPYCGVPDRDKIKEFYLQNECKFELKNFYRQIETNIFQDHENIKSQQRKLCCD